MAKSWPRLVPTDLTSTESKRTRRPPTTAWATTSPTAKRDSLRSQARDSVRQSQAARTIVREVIMPALSLWECSANMETSESQPLGLREPLESGQSGNAIPAPMLVVKAPRATSTKTQAAANAENAASAGLWPAVRGRLDVEAMGGGNGGQKAQGCPTQRF